jgi:hypothetical protein
MTAQRKEHRYCGVAENPRVSRGPATRDPASMAA